MTTTSAYVSTVGADRTIVLPESVPVGAKVAVVLLPADEKVDESETRSARFQIVMDAIQAAMDSHFATREVTEPELKQLIGEARQAAKA